MDMTLPNTLKRFFVTEIYVADTGGTPNGDALIRGLNNACRVLSREDAKGRDWSKQNRYVGYTSYGSIPDLPAAGRVFADLKQMIDSHVAAFAQQLELNLDNRSLKMVSCWINVLDPLGGHSGHIHPGSVLSGTYYVSMPPESGGLLFEDPRLPLMMNAPMRRSDARSDRQLSASVVPAAGTLLLWESWLRHEVPVNMSGESRISISFNYA